MKFETWLKKQKHRDDPIGDLANDFFRAQKMRKGTNDSVCDEEHLARWNACSDAYRALEDARKEFAKSLTKT